MVSEPQLVAGQIYMLVLTVYMDLKVQQGLHHLQINTYCFLVLVFYIQMIKYFCLISVIFSSRHLFSSPKVKKSHFS